MSRLMKPDLCGYSSHSYASPSHPFLPLQERGSPEQDCSLPEIKSRNSCPKVSHPCHVTTRHSQPPPPAPPSHWGERGRNPAGWGRAPRGKRAGPSSTLDSSTPRRAAAPAPGGWALLSSARRPAPHPGGGGCARLARLCALGGKQAADPAGGGEAAAARTHLPSPQLLAQPRSPHP